jgi:hypothetical protein
MSNFHATPATDGMNQESMIVTQKNAGCSRIGCWEPKNMLNPCIWSSKSIFNPILFFVNKQL